MTSVFTDLARHRLAQAVLVSGNSNKAAEAERICGFPIRHAEIDLPEIQSSDLVEIGREKAREAWRRAGCPVIIDETSLELTALNGFPGPLVKWMLDAIGPAGIARTAQALGEPAASAICLLILYDGSDTVLGEGRAEGRLVSPRGSHGFGFDRILQPDGETLTFAELGDSRKDTIGHRGLAWRDLARKLS